MKRLVGALVLVCASVFVMSANPVVAQQINVEDRFDPAQTLEFVQGMVTRANCTPICGNPTCCIAFEQQIPTHVGLLSFEEFQTRVQDLGLSIHQFASAVESDDSLYSTVGLQPVTDPVEASSEAAWLMNRAQDMGINLSCRVCCNQCGSLVCCGGCWTF